MTDSQVEQTRLLNGLTILGQVGPHNQSAALGFFVKTGARDELPQESGISHFLEHMIFKGTNKRSAMDITYELGNIGAQANAYTSEETTVYYATVIPENLPAMHELLADMLRPSLDPAEFSTEKKVILEEIALYEDRPHFYLYERATADFYGGHPAGNSVIGTVKSVGAIERDDMAAYFKRRYSPSNITLVATGNFDWPSFVKRSEEYCAAWPDFAAPREIKRFSAPAISKEYRKKNITQSHLLLMTGGPAAQDQERFEMSVLATILGDSSGSKLYWELIDKGLVESAGAESDERDGTGCFYAYASLEPGRLDEVSGIIRRVLTEAADFSADDLERAKTKLMTRIVLGGELPMGRLMALGNSWTYRRETKSLAEIIERLQAISRRDIEQAMAKFPIAKLSEFRLLPE